jgi:hypothetical protein
MSDHRPPIGHTVWSRGRCRNRERHHLRGHGGSVAVGLRTPPSSIGQSARAQLGVPGQWQAHAPQPDLALNGRILFRPHTACHCRYGNNTGCYQPKARWRVVACTNCRAQTLDVVLGCSPQRIRRQFDEGIEPCGKAPADLLMNTEDDGDSRAYRQAVPPRISRTPHVSTKSLYRSLLRNIGSGIHSESFFQLPSSNGEYGSRAA